MKWPIPALLLAVLSGAAPPAVPGHIRLEAEHMKASHNLGGYAIDMAGCWAASNRLAVDGLDVDGEWLQLAFTLDAPFCFVDSVRSAADDGVVCGFVLSLEPAAGGESSIPDTVTAPPGTGVTCNATVYNTVGNGRVHCLGPGTYTLTVRRVGDGYSRLDYVDLVEREAGVQVPHAAP